MKKIAVIGLALLLVTLSCVGVLAAPTEYRPSVENKAAPEIVTQTVDIQTEDGTKEITVVAVIKEGDETIGYVEEGGLIVTPLEKAQEAPLEEITEALLTANTELTEFGFTGAICEALTKAAIATGKGDSYDDFVVTDLFDVTLVNSFLRYISDDGTLRDPETEEGITLEITFDAHLTDADMTPVVVQKCTKDSEWQMVDPSCVTRNPDNTLTVRFDRLCAIAFLSIPNNVIVDEPEHLSPQTGFDESAANALATSSVSVPEITLIAVVATVLIAALACAIVRRTTVEK